MDRIAEIGTKNLLWFPHCRITETNHFHSQIWIVGRVIKGIIQIGGGIRRFFRHDDDDVMMTTEKEFVPTEQMSD